MGCKILDLHRQKSLGKHVCDHIISRAIDELNRAIFNDIVNEMKVDADVFGVSMILMIICECDGGLIVQKEGGSIKFAGEDL